MATVKIDKLEESDVFISNDRLTIVRTAYVSALSTTTPSAVLLNAATAVGINVGDAHPDQSNALCKTIHCVPKSSTQCLVVITYEWERPSFGGTDPFIFEYDTTLASEETTYDSSGNLTTVTYQVAGLTAGTQKPFVAKVHRLVPLTVIRATKTVYSPPPAWGYVGKTNNATWAGAAKHIWMCTGVHAVTQNGGGSYRVSYEFTAREQGWDEVAFWFDKDGHIPAEITSNYNAYKATPTDSHVNGWKKIQLAGEIDFSATWGNP